MIFQDSLELTAMNGELIKTIRKAAILVSEASLNTGGSNDSI